MRITNELIKYLYETYKNELYELRKKMKLRYSPRWAPQFDDIEGEILILLILYFKPINVKEFSPCGGWSSSIILDTLSINNNNAKLISYDIVNASKNNVISPKGTDWKFVLGDVSLEYVNWKFEEIDYLFIDSDHSQEFAKKYIALLLEPLLQYCRKINKQVLVSVHDIFHTNESSEEGEEVINFLEKNGISYYTPSLHKENHNFIYNLRNNLGGFDYEIHRSLRWPYGAPQTNSAIFFILC